MKKRLKVIIFSLIIFSLGITYSVFKSTADLIFDDQNVAGFIFKAEQVNEIELPITNINPGETKEYLFQVTNTQEEKTSDVTLGYEITINTYHFIPLEINLYKDDLLVGKCDETYSRNQKNELVCNMPVVRMDNSFDALDNYKLTVKFPVEYKSVIYSNLVDYIKLEIKSWQLLEG